jgi:protein arginine N-methyltransferase 1
MSQSELAEHRGYLADERKTAAYRAALDEVISPGDVVLDLGTGTGLLGYLACEAGAGSVVAVDRGDIVGLARRIATDNGFADRITHLRGMSTETELPTPANVAVCDQIGGLVHDAGILSCFADARQRLLAPDGILVPSSFRVFLAPVSFDIGRQAVEFWSSKPSGVDVSAARSLAANTEWKYRIVVDDVEVLAPGEELAAFPSDHEDPIGGTVRFQVEQSGRLDGLLGWFEAQMSPSVTLTNDPWSAQRFDRWCNFYPLDDAVDVRRGDEVGAVLDIRPRLGIVTWSTEVAAAGGGPVQRFRQSTFDGSFLTASTVEDFALGRTVPRTDRVDLAAAVLELIDGSHSQADIVQALSDRVGDGFLSRPHLETFVRTITTLVGG